MRCILKNNVHSFHLLEEFLGRLQRRPQRCIMANFVSQARSQIKVKLAVTTETGISVFRNTRVELLLLIAALQYGTCTLNQVWRGSEGLLPWQPHRMPDHISWLGHAVFNGGWMLHLITVTRPLRTVYVGDFLLDLCVLSNQIEKLLWHKPLK